MYYLTIIKCANQATFPF